MIDGQRLIPPLRPLDCTVIKVEGKAMVRVRDGLGISPDAAVPLPLFALAGLFDGSRSMLDVQAEIVRQTGEIFPSSELERIVHELDQVYFLDSQRFREKLKQVLGEWDRQTVRPPRHAGPLGSYAEEAARLERDLEAMYGRPGAVQPETRTSSRPLRAVLAPHIDFHRGGHLYTWAYHEVRRRGRAQVFVILGTSHQPMRHPFAITRKGYGTPWGPVAADAAFLDRMEKLCPDDLRQDEFNHKNEHSIEFQVIFLRHALGGRALGGAEFTIVPILCGGFHQSMLEGSSPDQDPRMERFLSALTATIAETRAQGREVVLIGGVDLAHVGQHFGDKDPLSPAFLEEVRARDRDLLVRAAELDSRGFFQEIAREQDRLRICGAGPIYTLLGVLEREGGRSRMAGELLSYDQAVDLENDLCVSFASMAFEDR